MTASDVDRGEAELRALPGGVEALERIAFLERARDAAGAAGPDPENISPSPPPGRGTLLDADVVIAGGGLWLILAVYLARRGVRVVVVERGRAGDGHREWNVSAPELAPFFASGVFTPAEIDPLIVARYERGLCRWHGGGSYPVTGVLDHAVSGEAFLAALRGKAERAGVRVLDGREARRVAVGRGGVAVETFGREGRGELTARVLVDARGASSPYASADLVCPTVGGVLRGLARGEAADEVDPRVGEILVTVDDREDGRQHIWEGFPGAGGDLTTYLFYYARARPASPRTLVGLYGRFFRTRHRYKRGEASPVRLTYGFIPGWSRLGPPPRPREARVVLVGDAAARHSPLTFCGFGSMARSFAVVGAGLMAALADDDLSRARLASLAPEPPLLGAVGALALLLTEARRAVDPRATNRLLDAAFSALSRAGEATYAGLLRDTLSGREFARFLRRTASERPEVYADVRAFMTPGELARWAATVARGALGG